MCGGKIVFECFGCWILPGVDSQRDGDINSFCHLKIWILDGMRRVFVPQTLCVRLYARVYLHGHFVPELAPTVRLYTGILTHSPSEFHYSDVIMGTMSSEITSLIIVYSTVYSGVDHKTSKLCLTGLCAGNSPVTGEFPAQMVSNAENVSIWWCHHVRCNSNITILLRDRFTGTCEVRGIINKSRTPRTHL